MKISVRAAKDNEYMRMKHSYNDIKVFDDINKNSAEYSDFIDELYHKNAQFEVYKNVNNNGATVFYTEDTKNPINAQSNINSTDDVYDIDDERESDRLNDIKLYGEYDKVVKIWFYDHEHSKDTNYTAGYNLNESEPLNDILQTILDNNNIKNPHSLVITQVDTLVPYADPENGMSPYDGELIWTEGRDEWRDTEYALRLIQQEYDAQFPEVTTYTFTMDYDDENGATHTISEEFTGTRDEMSNRWEELDLAGYYNIEVDNPYDYISSSTYIKSSESSSYPATLYDKINKFLNNEARNFWAELVDVEPYKDLGNVYKVTIQVEGDWKHEHIRFNHLFKENFNTFPRYDEYVIGSPEEDTYTANHVFYVGYRESDDEVEASSDISAEGQAYVESLDKITQDKIWNIIDIYNTSVPVSGDWSTETEHELNTIKNKLGISEMQAAWIMIYMLGFDPDEIESIVNASTKIEASSYRHPGFKGGYLYILKHGIGPGTLPADVNIIQGWDLPNGATAVVLDKFLDNESLNEYDIPYETENTARLARQDFEAKIRPDGFYDIVNISTGEPVQPFRDDSKVTASISYSSLKNKYSKEQIDYVFNAHDEYLETLLHRIDLADEGNYEAASELSAESVKTDYMIGAIEDDLLTEEEFEEIWEEAERQSNELAASMS